MTKWRVSGREYISPSNITRVTITEDTNWQRIVVNIAGNLSQESDQHVIDKAIEVFITREKPEFAQEVIDQSIANLQEELSTTRKTVQEAKEIVDTAKANVEVAQKDLGSAIMDMSDMRGELEDAKSELSQTKSELSETKNDLLVTQDDLSTAKEDLVSTQEDLSVTKQSIEDIKEEVSGLVLSIQNLTDEQREILDDKYDPWEDGISYSPGDRVHYEAVNYEVLQEHTSQGDWLPSDTPSLYKVIKNDDIETDEGTVEVIDEFEASSTNPYGIGDKVTFQGKVYESTIDNNVWSPADYPQGWKEVTI